MAKAHAAVGDLMSGRCAGRASGCNQEQVRVNPTSVTLEVEASVWKQPTESSKVDHFKNGAQKVCKE